MRVFGFDLLPYPEHLDHLKVDGELPYPLPRKHFRPDLAVATYREHLDAWALMDELGFDGVGFFHTLSSHGNISNVGRQRLRAGRGAWLAQARESRGLPQLAPGVPSCDDGGPEAKRAALLGHAGPGSRWTARPRRGA